LPVSCRRKNRLENRSLLASEASLNICNYCDISHGAYAPATSRRRAKQLNVARKGDELLEINAMKKLLATSAALATVLAALSSPAFAARRAPVGHDTPYGQPSGDQTLARPSDLAVTEGRVVGADPDINIRTQLLRDLDQAGF
jgi:hypothetical protein